jgi:hypothetical protein
LEVIMLQRVVTVQRIVSSLTLAAALGCPTAYAQDRHGNHAPAVPAILEVEDGYSPFLIAHAVGTQNYMCLPSGSSVAWRFFAPQATLFHDVHGEGRQQLATHFLSANPDEGGLARATWQDSGDSSRVWGRMLQTSSDARFVAFGAIPWLLLEVVGAERGPVGSGGLSRAAFIHRVNTSGGIAPAAGCTQASNVGALALVPYEADYVFYRADGRK